MIYVAQAQDPDANYQVHDSWLCYPPETLHTMLQAKQPLSAICLL